MRIARILAHLSCRDLAAGQAWFAALFGREPDTTPMPGLAEWHHREDGGLQLFRDARAAGTGTLTLIVEDADAEHARLAGLGHRPGAIETTETVTLFRLRDPDGNLVVVVQAPGAR